MLRQKLERIVKLETNKLKDLEQLGMSVGVQDYHRLLDLLRCTINDEERERRERQQQRLLRSIDKNMGK